MSYERRLKLLAWASEAGVWIFEDDYDGLLRCDGRHPQALQSLDRTGCVIYSNSLNSILLSSLRLGFLILPPAFVEPAAAALSISQRYQPPIAQATLADFIALGHFDRHVERMRELHTERREALIAAGITELGGLMQFSDSQVGSQVIGWLAAGTSEAEVWRRAAARNIDTVALASLTIDRPMPPGLVFGLGAANARAIRTGIRRLGRVLRVLAWQTEGSRSIQKKVPVRSRSEVSQEAPTPIERRLRPEARSSTITPTRSPQLAPTLSPRYRQAGPGRAEAAPFLRADMSRQRNPVSVFDIRHTRGNRVPGINKWPAPGTLSASGVVVGYVCAPNRELLIPDLNKYMVMVATRCAVYATHTCVAVQPQSRRPVR
jgi:hypothetical protein